jgi:TRAP-type mannitol/chloroaromatic compound transport system permease large subunit
MFLIKKIISFCFNLLIDLASILSAARNQHDICLTQEIFDRIKQLFPQIKPRLASARVLLANTYASNGDFLKSSNIRMEMVESGLKKKIGISKTVINGQIHVSFTMKKRLNSNENCLFNLGIRSSR